MSRDFNGTTGALRCTVAPNLARPWIITLWVKFDTLTGVHTLWSRQKSTAPGPGATFYTIHAYPVVVGPSTFYYVKYLVSENGSDPWTGFCYANVGFSTGVWYQITVWEGANDTDRTIWVNGDPITSHTNSILKTMTATTHTCLGAFETATTPSWTQFLDGQLAEVCEWDNDDGAGGEILSQAETGRLALALYESKMRPNLYRPNACRYTRLLRDEDASLSMIDGLTPSLFTVYGGVSVGEHPPITDFQFLGTHRRRPGGDVERHEARGVLRGVGRGVYSR